MCCTRLENAPCWREPRFLENRYARADDVRSAVDHLSAQCFCFLQEQLRRAAGEVKALHMVQGATHMSLQDEPAQTREALEHLVPPSWL